MGISTSIYGEWLSAGDEAVLLWFHGLRHGEVTSNLDSRCRAGAEGADEDSMVQVKKSQPALALVGSGYNLAMEFQTLPISARGGAEEMGTGLGMRMGTQNNGESSGSGTVTVGGICLPLDSVADTCGGSLFYTWFPLNDWQQSAHSSLLFHQFDLALQNHWSLACVSLCQVSPDKVQDGQTDLPATPPAREFSFTSVMLSHGQHAALVQALYRHCRALRTETATEAGSSRSTSDRTTSETIRPEIDLDASAAYLREAITTKSKKAAERLGQVEKAVSLLREQLASRGQALAQQRSAVSGLGLQADSQERENDELRAQLEGRGAIQEAREAQRQSLKRKVGILEEHKQTLVSLLEAFFHPPEKAPEAKSSAALGHPSASAAPPAISPAASSVAATLPIVAAASPAPAANCWPSPAAQSSVPEPQFKNMLPRPSEFMPP